MKAVVLCAGLGTRLRPLTFSTAKHLIPVANKPVLFYGIESLVEVGAREIGIVVSRESRPLIQNAVDDGSRWGARVTYIEQHKPQGLAHACACAEEFVGGEPFIMYLGDNLLPDGLRAPVSLFQSSGANAVVLLKEVDDPTHFGIAEVQGNRIVRLVEKPKHPPSNLAIVGGYIFDRNIFDSIRRIRPSWRGEYEITDAIQDLVDRGFLVVPYVVPGWWKDTGKPEDILDANRVVLQGMHTAIEGKVDAASELHGTVIVAAGAEIVNSRIEGPVIIGSEARVFGAHVGPYVSLGDRVHVLHSTVRNSVIMEDSRIEHLSLPLRDSLIGRRVIVRGGSSASGLRLLLGDYCETEMGD
ncbi:MAG: glucose-1-phosphate thymidylyltransferase [Candidatus Binatia bacterium]|nr:MAG: glucose-1-phosphate thymidylyltransferase [Candidatus Binatia bacterium]